MVIKRLAFNRRVFYSRFPDFLIPGLFLFTVNGLGSMVGDALSFARNRYAPKAAIALGAILVAWIIGTVHWLHLLYFTLGLMELAIGLFVVRLRKLAA